MNHFEVDTPIINDAVFEPTQHWLVQGGAAPRLVAGRRPPGYYHRDQPMADTLAEASSADSVVWVPLELANRLRGLVRAWRKDGFPGCSRVTRQLLEHWENTERIAPLFFCQREAAETVIFLVEAPPAYRHNVQVPLDEAARAETGSELEPFQRYALKMAAGTGKTTVLAMLIAWNLLNFAADPRDPAWSDTVLVVCPNVTVRQQLAERLNPAAGATNLYLVHDLVPSALLHQLHRGRVEVVHWHAFGRRNLNAVGRERSPVVQRGRESDAVMVRRVLGSDPERLANVLVINDEAHHAYRSIAPSQSVEGTDAGGGGRARDRAAAVWLEGLDTVHRERGINFCIDLSAMPFYPEGDAARGGRPFPWVVSDFGFAEAIESGLVKSPQLPLADVGDRPIRADLNLWQWVLDQAGAEDEVKGLKGPLKPRDVLKHVERPLAQLAGLWADTFRQWELQSRPTPPVFVVVCDHTPLARAVHGWFSGGQAIPELANTTDREVTVCIDKRVLRTLETGLARNDEDLRLRYVLETVGQPTWSGGRPPEGWVTLCRRWNRRAEASGGTRLQVDAPPGRDVRCIVTVSLVVEGWVAPTVTHIVALRPFESQPLCEHVVGRAFRRLQYYDLLTEEVAQVYGVPFEFTPFKAQPGQEVRPQPAAHHICPVYERQALLIPFPRVDGYVPTRRSSVTMRWDQIPEILIDPDNAPHFAFANGPPLAVSARGALWGPNRMADEELAQWRATTRLQELEWDMAGDLARQFTGGSSPVIPIYVLFPQVLAVVRRFLINRVVLRGRADVHDVFLSPYYGWAVGLLAANLIPEIGPARPAELPQYKADRAVGSTLDVDFWTGRPVWPTRKSHLNGVVGDTLRWEQSATYYLEQDPSVYSYARNQHLGFLIPYQWQGSWYVYQPDYLVRLQEHGRMLGTLVLTVVVGRDERAEAKEAGAQRWVAAVNNDEADRSCGMWTYQRVHDPTQTRQAIAESLAALRQLG